MQKAKMQCDVQAVYRLGAFDALLMRVWCGDAPCFLLVNMEESENGRGRVSVLDCETSMFPLFGNSPSTRTRWVSVLDCETSMFRPTDGYHVGYDMERLHWKVEKID